MGFGKPIGNALTSEYGVSSGKVKVVELAAETIKVSEETIKVYIYIYIIYDLISLYK